jgi:hypothetical protein
MVIYLYDRDGAEVAEVLDRVAAMLGGARGEPFADACDQLMLWAGATPTSQKEAATRLRAIVKEIEAQSSNRGAHERSITGRNRSGSSRSPAASHRSASSAVTLTVPSAQALATRRGLSGDPALSAVRPDR